MEVTGLIRAVLIAFFVDVISGVAIETVPELTSYMGHRVSLPCVFTAEGSNWMFIRWTKTTEDGTIILASMQNNIFLPQWSNTAPVNFKDHVELDMKTTDTSYSLDMVIDGLQCADIGNYTCQVFTMDDDITATTSLDIQAHPGSPLIREDVFEMEENTTFNLLCEADVGIPPSTIRWSYSLLGQDIYLQVQDNIEQYNSKGEGEQCSYHGRSRLSITMEKKYDGAKFMCLTNSIGDQNVPGNSDIVMLQLSGKTTTTVTPKPTTTFAMSRDDQGTNSGNQVTISMMATLICILSAMYNIGITRT